MTPGSDAGLPVDQARRARGEGILAAWRTGWQAALGMPGILVLKWLVNLAFAVAAALPVAALLEDHLGSNAVGEQVFRSLGTDLVAEFVIAATPRLRLAALASAPIALAYLLVNLYLTGGILHRLRGGVRGPWSEFFDSCNGHLSLLLRVGLSSAVLSAVAVGIPHFALARLVETLTEDASGPQPLFYLTWLHWAILLLLVSWVARVYDYARIAAFLRPEGRARTALLRGMRFTLRRGRKTLALWLLLILPPLAVSTAFATAPITDGVGTMAAMWASLALGQALLALRILGSFATLGGQMEFMASSLRR